MTDRNGFTLPEVLIVVLIIGLLSAVAAPKLMDNTTDARESNLRRTLAVVRNAIELYRSENGAFPGADGSPATFKSDLAPYLQSSSFPAAPLGPVAGNKQIRMKNDGVPLTGNPAPNRAWKFDYTTGEFIFNYYAISSDGSTNYEDF